MLPSIKRILHKASHLEATAKENKTQLIPWRH